MSAISPPLLRPLSECKADINLTRRQAARALERGRRNNVTRRLNASPAARFIPFHQRQPTRPTRVATKRAGLVISEGGLGPLALFSSAPAIFPQ
jgi:hypothetical protein